MQEQLRTQARYDFCWGGQSSCLSIILQDSMCSSTGLYRLPDLVCGRERCDECSHRRTIFKFDFSSKMHLKSSVSVHHFLEHHRWIWYNGAKNGTVPASRHAVMKQVSDTQPPEHRVFTSALQIGACAKQKICFTNL